MNGKKMRPPWKKYILLHLCVEIQYNGILFWFFSLTRLKKKSWPLILSFSPSCRSRKNWEKHYFEAEATPKPQKMFFSVFPTEGTWGKTQNQRSTFFLKKRVREKKLEQNAFFIFHSIFVRIHIPPKICFFSFVWLFRRGW